MRLSFTAFFVLIVALVARPVFSWSCKNRYSMSGMQMSPNSFYSECTLSGNPGCHLHDGSSGDMELEVDSSSCVETGDVLMMCTSIYASSFDKNSKVSLGAAEDERDVDGAFKNGAYSEVCTQTFACGDDDIARSAFVTVEGVKGQVSVVGSGTTISKPRFLPLPNKGAKKTKLGALYPNEKLMEDGMYNFTFIPSQYKEAMGLSQIMGHVTSVNASFSRLNNAYLIFRGGHVDFNHCDQLKHYDTTSTKLPVIRMSGRHAQKATPSPLEVQISADGIHWESRYNYSGFEELLGVSLPSADKCHVRITLTKSTESEEENYWLFKRYMLEIPTTEKPNAEETGAQIMYYQTYCDYNSTISLTDEFLANPPEYQLKKGAQLMFPIVFRIPTTGAYEIKAVVPQTSVSPSLSKKTGSLEPGVDNYVNATLTIEDVSWLKYGSDVRLAVIVQKDANTPITELVIELSGKGYSGGGGASSGSKSSGSQSSGKGSSGSNIASASALSMLALLLAVIALLI